MGSPIYHENLGHERGDNDEGKLDDDDSVRAGEYLAGDVGARNVGLTPA